MGKILSELTDILKKPVFHIIFIAILGLIVYSNTFQVPFHFDDTPNIVENYKLRNLDNFWPPSGTRWFGFLTFALNYNFGGLNTVGYHIVNFSIHILNAILVYWLVVLTLGIHDAGYTIQDKKNHEFRRVAPTGIMNRASWIMHHHLIALFSALIFVSHPIQTQAVTYIVQRFTSLATLFYLFSLVMYIKFRIHDTRYMIQDKKSKNPESCIMHRASEPKLHAKRYALYAISLISAILAMKTKEIAFTLPIIIALYEFMFFDGNSKKRIIFLIPLLLTMFIIPLSLIGIDKPIGDAIGELREAAQETEEIPRWSYLFTQFRVIVTYIRLLFLPINQNLDYDYSIYHSFFNPGVFLSFLFLLATLALGVYLLYHSRTAAHNSSTLHSLRYALSATRLIAFGIFWFFITLSVESSIIPIRDVIFEHRVYLPSIGVFISIISVVFIVAGVLKNRWQQIEKIIIPALFIMTIALSVVTYARNMVWKNELILWKDVARKSSAKARVNNNLGKVYWDKGLTEMAIKCYENALKLKPNYALAHNNLGVAYNLKGLTDKAIAHLQIALSLTPNYSEAYNNLGIAYSSKGLIDKAIEHFQIASILKPNAEAHFHLGVIYIEKGLIDTAHQEFEIALQINPNHYQARLFLNYIRNLKKKGTAF